MCPTPRIAALDPFALLSSALHPHAPQAAPELCYSSPASEQGAPGADCSLHGRRLLEPYPRLEPLQLKRLAARRHATTYCYDFPTVFENALRDIWWVDLWVCAVARRGLRVRGCFWGDGCVLLRPPPRV